MEQGRPQELTDRARERHDALTAAIERLEHALAAAAPQRVMRWSERVGTELGLVREAIHAHVVSIEEPDGLFDEIERSDPRLARRVAGLRRDHSGLLEEAQQLTNRLPLGERADFAGMRRDLGALLASLREHRAAEADLLYEAFWIDIGACD